MTLGQRVAVMRDGVIQQVDAPQALYVRPGQPLRRRVHRLAGDEPRRGDGRGRRRRSFAGWVPLDPARRPEREGRVILGIRPEAFEDAAFADPALPTSTSTCSCSRSSARTRTRSSRSTLRGCEAEDAARRRRPRGGRADRRRPAALERAGLVAHEGARRARRCGWPSTPGALYFFDPETGASLTPGRRSGGRRLVAARRRSEARDAGAGERRVRRAGVDGGPGQPSTPRRGGSRACSA